MSRSRALAVLSSLVATLAMTVGLLAFTSGAASATPRGHHNEFHNHYPMSPPVLVVNKGVVKYGTTVKATGKRYAKKEKVYVTVYFKAKGSNTAKFRDARIRFNVSMMGRLKRPDRWAGTFAGKARVKLRNGDKTTCKLRRVDWAATS